jgi:PIN domain nuclease of toxin-antitoxin system
VAGGLEKAAEVKLLLDTNALLWTLTRAKRLSPEVSKAIRAEDNDVYVSVVSVWEIEIKAAKRKLRPVGDVKDALAQQRFSTLPVTLPHVLAVESLPRYHRDPFDRLLIAQAQLEGLTLVTSDREMRNYPIAVLPAT